MVPAKAPAAHIAAFDAANEFCQQTLPYYG
jgi:hypothetical protein